MFTVHPHSRPSACLVLAASLLTGVACKSRPSLEFGAGLDVPYVQTARASLRPCCAWLGSILET